MFEAYKNLAPNDPMTVCLNELIAERNIDINLIKKDGYWDGDVFDLAPYLYSNSIGKHENAGPLIFLFNNANNECEIHQDSMQHQINLKNNYNPKINNIEERIKHVCFLYLKKRALLQFVRSIAKETFC